MSIHDKRVFPSGYGACTMTVELHWRAQKGVGAYSQPSGYATVLTYPTVPAYNMQVPLPALFGAIVERWMDLGFGQLVSPQAGQSPEGALHEALRSATVLPNSSVLVRVFVDGPETVSIG